MLVLMASVKRITDARDLRRRIEQIKRRKLIVSGAPKTIQELSLRRKKIDDEGFINLLLQKLPSSKRVNNLLTRAGVKISPKQFITRCFIAVVVVTLIVTFALHQSILLAVPVALICGVWLPFKWLKIRINKQAKAFLTSFPEAIDLIVRGLRSGLPVSESIVQVSTELPDPVGGVFTIVANTMKLGVPLEKALLETAKQLDLREFFFFTTSIVLQRETGGNLSEILNNLSEVLRARFMMKMKIHALTSEARASAYIIGALPFVVTAAIASLSPAYLKPLFEEEGGHQALAVAAFMMGFGMWSMNRMAQFEI